MRIAVLTDIHEDLESLTLAISKIEQQGYDMMVCLGDITGFSAPHYNHYETRDAHGCLNLLREKCSVIIAGNHDYHSAGITPPPESGFSFPEDWYSMDLFERRIVGGGAVWLYDDELPAWYNREDKEFIATLQAEAEIDTEESRIYLSHFIYPNLCGALTGFVSNYDDYTPHFDRMISKGCNLAIAGHMHPRRMTVIDRNGISTPGFGRSHKVNSEETIVVSPSVTGERRGFVIYDSEKGIAKASRI